MAFDNSLFLNCKLVADSAFPIHLFLAAHRNIGITCHTLPLTPILTLYTPIPGSVSVFLLDVGGWLSRGGLEDLKPFLVLAELLVVLVSGLVSLTVLIVTLLLSLSILVSIAAGEAGAGELWPSDLGSVEGAELQATPESLGAGLSGGSVCERISSWTMSLRPTL